MSNQSTKLTLTNIEFSNLTLIFTLVITSAGMLFSASMAFAGLYYVENPSVICSAHFNKSFGDFFDKTAHGYSLSFDEKKHASKQRWGYEYNGVLIGQNSSMLLNWAKKSDYGIITVLDLDYPCRASYARAASNKINLLNEVEELISTDSPSKQSTSPPPATVSTPSESSTSAVTVSTTPATSTVSVSASSTKWRDARILLKRSALLTIQASIVMFMAISDVIKQQPLTMKDRVLSVVDSEIARLQQEKQLLQDQLSSRFSTPIRPNNANLSVSAFRAADTFPKIPFYVPGTNEIGEMLVVPRVSDEAISTTSSTSLIRRQPMTGQRQH